MIGSLLGLLSTDMAIDLGTANTLVYVKNQGVVIDEPSVVAYRKEGNRKIPHAVGAQAKLMLGKTPIAMEAIRPMKDGVIADFQAAELMIRGMIKMINPKRKLFTPSLKMVVCIPFQYITAFIVFSRCVCPGCCK